MKRSTNRRRKKFVKRSARKAAAKVNNRDLSLERLDDRLLLDADGLAITSPSTGSIRSGLTDVMNVTADDPAATFSISGGDDAGQFSIDPASGALSFNSPPDHGSPVRLLVPGSFGYKSIKWLTRIEATDVDEVFGSYQEQLEYWHS